MRLILASTSAYRKILLERLGIAFEAVAPQVDESAFQSSITDPDRLAVTLAAEKAKAVSTRFPDAIVIGSDQVVAIEGQPLGKPGSFDQALSQLEALRGRTHELLTAVAVCHGSARPPIEHLDRTKLTMRPLARPALERYLHRDQPFDCAGSYKIEAAGIALFSRIETDDFTAITGLPLIALAAILAECGIEIP